MMTVKRYAPRDASVWNTFVANAANATFLLDRRFLEYHKDRFIDHSLLLYENKKLIAVFPANSKGRSMYSHDGLTYGGLMVAPYTSLLTMLSCFYHLLKYYHDRRILRLIYKPVPVCFHTTPTRSDEYALFCADARLTALNTGFVASPPSRISKRRLRMVGKAKRARVVVKKTTSARFWNDILIPHLWERYHTKPIHTAEEIARLEHLFAGNIKQYGAFVGNTMVAGVTIFHDRGIAHAQYIASNAAGREVGALDYLFWHLLTHTYTHARYFSFGTTNMGSPDGKKLSAGLVAWKEGFGSSMTPYPCYTIQTKNYGNIIRHHSVLL